LLGARATPIPVFGGQDLSNFALERDVWWSNNLANAAQTTEGWHPHDDMCLQHFFNYF